MSIKGPNVFSGETKTSGASSADNLSVLWQTIHETTTQAHSALRDDFNRAQDEYRLNRYDKAEATLRTLVGYLNNAMTKNALEASEGGQLAALRAAAHSVLGRVYERLDRCDEATDSFKCSVQMYSEMQRLKQEAALTPQDYRDLGIALYKLERLDEALYIFRKATELGDQSAETNTGIGSILHQRSQLEEAQPYLRRAVELNPDDVAANVVLAENLEAQGLNSEATNSYLKAAFIDAQHEKWDDALNLIERCSKLTPENIRVLAVKAEIFRLIDRYDEALQALDQILKIQPNEVMALGIKGQILRALDRNEEAIEVLENAIEENSELTWLQSELGENLRLLGRHEEALNAFTRALDLEPANVLAREGKSASLIILEHYDEALRMLDELLEEDPENAFAWASKGEALRLAGKDEEALEALERGLALEPKDAFALGTKGQILRSLNRTEDAAQALVEALEIDPNLGWAHAELGEALRLLGRHEEALAELDLALKTDPNNAFVLGSKGAVLYATRKYPEALEALNQSLRAMPNYAWAFSLKGAVLCDLGAFAEAVETLTQITDDNPSHLRSYSLLLRGWALENLGTELGEATKAFAKAHELDPDNLWSKKGIANVLYARDKREEAKSAYEEILNTLDTMGELDAPTMALKGWCLYRVGQYDDAMRRLVDALSLDPHIIYAQFDLALVSMESDRYALGMREYDRALELLAKQYVLRRRGLLHVALRDLKIAMDHNPTLREAKEAQAARKKLGEEFKKVEQDGSARKQPAIEDTGSSAAELAT